jgi:preprotein translocase subunit SecF
MEFLKNPNFDFFGKTKYFVALSLLILTAGVVKMSHHGGIRYGVEFSGGTELVLHFASLPHVDRVRQAVEPVAPGATIQVFDNPTKNQVLVRIASTDEKDLSAPVHRVLNALHTAYSENELKGYSAETVGPVVGAELRKKAIQLTVLGLLFQLVYIAVRFKGGIWGAGAAIAGLHDILITMAFLTFFHYEITLNVIAALLTLVGYSVYDTIVVFDRARENLKQRRKDTLVQTLNASVNQTLSRTLISNGLTFLSVFGLYLFGGEVLKGFAFAMVVGILVGTYSTIYIASPIVLLWETLSKRRQVQPS